MSVSVPGYISRSVAGSYDNEGIAIFALMFTYYLWVIISSFYNAFDYYSDTYQKLFSSFFSG